MPGPAAFGVYSPQELAEVPPNGLDRVVAALAKAGAKAVTLPGDVYQGNIEQGSPEYYDRAGDLAQLMIGAPGGAGGVGSGLRRAAPTFSERMTEAQDVAQAIRNRGRSIGDYGMGTAKRTAPDAPKGSFDRLADETRAGFQGDKARILDEYRAATGSTPESKALLAPGESFDDMASALFSGGNKKAGGVLAMDEAARIARAKEQGFTVDAYRGEGGPIEGNRYVIGHPTRNDGGYLGADAIYATNEPYLANDYATLKKYRLGPDAEAPNVVPLKLKMENPLRISGDEKQGIAYLGQSGRDEWLRGVKAKGHDGVIVDYGGRNPSHEYAVFNPEAQMRSRFAAFDPNGDGSLLSSGGNANMGALIQALKTYQAQQQ